MPGSQFEVIGLKELRKELKALGPKWPKMLREANLEAAHIGAYAAESNALGMGSVQAKAASAIKASGTQNEARIVVSAGGAHPYSLGAFLGAKQFPQFPEWVGNNWEPGGPGGPYAINPALREKESEILDVYGDAVDKLTKAAFPGR